MNLTRKNDAETSSSVGWHLQHGNLDKNKQNIFCKKQINWSCYCTACHSQPLFIVEKWFEKETKNIIRLFGRNWLERAIIGYLPAQYFWASFLAIFFSSDLITKLAEFWVLLELT